jgi:hypothetical protein
MLTLSASYDKQVGVFQQQSVILSQYAMMGNLFRLAKPEICGASMSVVVARKT